MLDDERLTHRHEVVTRRREPEPQIVVLGSRQTLVEPADAREGVPPDQGGRGRDVPSPEQRIEHIAFRRRQTTGDVTPGQVVASDPGAVRHRDPRVGRLPEPGQLSLELRGQPLVVTVEEGHEVGARGPESLVPGPAATAVRGKRQEADAGVGQRSKLPHRVVGRGVVDDDQLQVTDRLLEDAADGADHHPRAVVGGDHDADRTHPRPSNDFRAPRMRAAPPAVGQTAAGCGRRARRNVRGRRPART